MKKIIGTVFINLLITNQSQLEKKSNSYKFNNNLNTKYVYSHKIN